VKFWLNIREFALNARSNSEIHYLLDAAIKYSLRIFEYPCPTLLLAPPADGGTVDWRKVDHSRSGGNGFWRWVGKGYLVKSEKQSQQIDM